MIRPEYAQKKNEVCSHVLASSLLQMLCQKFRWLDKAPGRVKWVLYAVSRIAIQGFLPIQRRLPFVC